MKKYTLFKILQLDSLTNILHWKERIMIHLYLMGKAKMTTSKIICTHEWIEENNWEPPLMKYGQDCLQYFYDPDSDLWLPVEDYLKLFTEYKKSLWNIQLNHSLKI